MFVLPTERVTTGSCRYNCGYNTGHCSCTSDCWYNSNCCPDYNCYSNCGGVLTSTSGSFSSPNYPRNYYNSEYCVWQIRVPYGQRIILAFTEFQ
ncbi:hypothetical protein GN956_G11303 [Arapaima gigas]